MRRDISAFYVSFTGPTALFMSQPTFEKRENNVLPFKKYFITVFLVISVQFSAK